MSRTPSQPQRARRLLNQATMQRSHRRSELLVRALPENKVVPSTSFSEQDAVLVSSERESQKGF